jgi:hypothetical protein
MCLVIHIPLPYSALLSWYAHTHPSRALSRPSQANILPAIFECARPDTCPPELNLEAAQLLLVLSEDSRAFATQVSGNAMCVQVCATPAAESALLRLSYREHIGVDVSFCIFIFV